MKNMEEEKGALKLAEAIEDSVNSPENTVNRIDKKIGKTPGIFSIIKDFINSYEAKEPDTSNEEWLASQFAKPEYADAFKGKNAEKERLETAKGIVQGVEDYENAKKSLSAHIKEGGDSKSWLAEQIEIGAEINNIEPTQYADEIAQGLDEAIEENVNFVFSDKEENE